ncbi:MAG: hypothetical protein O3C40_05170 [Planctomycetota bacterium]|nr:hypothetical protein [Planctomycetota bacterium]
MIQNAMSRVECFTRVAQASALTAIIICQGSVAHTSFAQTNDPLSAPLPSEAIVGSEQYRKTLLERRRTDVTSLRQALSTCPDSWAGDLQKKAIIELLGELRASEAADDLVRIVSFTPALHELGEPSDLQHYPAAHSLVRIGVPAHRAIFNRLHHPVTDEELKVFAYILSAHAGLVDAPTGLFYIRRAKPATKAFPQLQENLDAAETIMNSRDFGKMSDWPAPRREPGAIPQEVPANLLRR